MKRALFGVAALALLAATGVAVWFYLSLDWIVKRAIESYVPDIIGAEVKLESVALSPASGAGVITGVVIGNAKGFSAPQAATVRTVEVSVDPATIAKEVVLVRRIAVVGPTITYQVGRNGSNFDAFKRNVDNYVGKPDPRAARGATRLIVERLTIRGATVNFVPELPVRGATIGYALPDIQLANVGKRQGGVTPGEVSKIVLDALVGRMTQAMGRRAGERALQNLLSR